MKKTLLLLLILISSFAFGQKNTWNGILSTDWNNWRNWSEKQVPTSAHDVVIPDMGWVLPTYPSINKIAALAKSVTIDPNATLTLTNSATSTLTVSGGFINNSTLNAGAVSMVTIDGATASVIGGTSKSTFGNLTINKIASATTVTNSTKAFAVTNNLTVTQGNLVLAATDANYTVGSDLTVAPAGILSHNVDWDLFEKLLLVGGNLDIIGIYSYSSVPRSHIQMNGTGKNIRTGSSALSILTLKNTSGTITANGSVTVNDNFWSSFGTAGTFATGVNTITATGGLFVHGGKLSINSGTVNVVGGLNVGNQGLNGAVVFSTGNLTVDNVIIGNGTVNSIGTFTHSGGTANIGNLIINGNGANVYTCTGAPTINIRGNWTNNKTFTAATSTVNFVGVSAQMINGTLSGTTGKFYNLTMNGAGATNTAPLEIANTLTMTNGILTTGGTNLLNITNPSSMGTSGGSAASFVNGPMKWATPLDTKYNFPIGKGSSYLPFVLKTNGTNGITAQVEAFNSNNGGRADLATLLTLSSTEYWSLITSGTFNNSSVSIARPASITPLNAIAASATVNGVYSSLAGSAGPNGVIDSTPIGTAGKFFTFGGKGCKPSSTKNDRYISNVKFLGTLNPNTSNPTLYSSNGYGDHRALTARAKQIQGGVINLNVTVGVTTGNNLSTVKAWVDWNRDGVYNDDVSEKIYDTSGVGVLSGNVIFGYVVPATTLRGVYNIRIRVNSGNETFGPCGNTGDGETEDYSFNVVEFCSARILSVTAGQQCGPGPVVLSATATTDTISYNWYTDEFSNPIAGQTGNTYTTQSLSVGTYTYYVTANNGTCSTPILTPVKVTVSPTPAIVLAKSVPDICGTVNSLIITSSGDKEQVTVLEDKFENTVTAPLKFVNVIDGNPNANGIWQLRNTPFIPSTAEYNILKPAISSGYSGGKFANIITDVRQNTNILNNWVTINPLNTLGITQLKMEFDLYYFSEEDDVTRSYLKVQYSLDGLTNWIDLQTYSSDVGVPSRFMSESLNLPVACENISTLKVRFSVFATGSNREWLADIAAIDNVKIYGTKDLPTNLSWSGDNGTLYPSSCTGPIPVGGASTVCVKFSDTDLKTKSQFTVTASAILSNGCNATGTIVINNNTKIWDATSVTDWNSSNWQPADSKIPPIADKCVVIKTPVILSSGPDGLAKNITVETGGSLKIEGNLTVTDFVKNETGADKFVVSNDANLIQITETAENTGDITVLRNSPMKKSNYTYWSSPVSGRQLAAFSPLTATARFYEYLESTNLFKTVPKTSDFIPTKGYAIMAPATYTLTALQTFEGKFVGVPTNGTQFKTGAATTALEFPLALSSIGGNQGYNLIGNPYPSNIDFEVLHSLNSSKIYNTAYFWTNVDPNRPGSSNGTGNSYSGNAYAIYNGTGGVSSTAPAGAPNGGPVPTQYIKVGQGFIVKAKPGQNGEKLVFNNSIRNSTGSSTFFSKGTASAKDRFWLKLTTPALNVNTILIGYVPGASNDFEWDYDAPLFSVASDSFYSLLNDDKLGIQGRTYPLDRKDVVALGTKHFEVGNYTLSLGDHEGIFAQGQAIYLKDKETGTITNLTEGGSYTFAIGKGEFTNRFEIIYESEITLVTDGSTKSSVEVYRDAMDFVVHSSTKAIDSVELYDASGRLILTLKGNNGKELRFNAEKLVDGMYVLKAIMKGGEPLTKKIRK